MTGKEYINSLKEVNFDTEMIEKVSDIYSGDFPDIVKKLISNAKEPVFLDNDYRIFSFDEILDAETDLHVSFSDKGILPLVDCGDNDFIVYQYMEMLWSKFNITDEIVFSKKNSFDEFFK